MTTKWIYRVLLLVSFVLINVFLLFGFGKFWTFFNSGADRSSMLHPSGADINLRTARVSWFGDQQLTEGVRRDLEKAYLGAERSRQLVMEGGEAALLSNFYSDSLQARIQKMASGNAARGTRVHEWDLEHNLALEHFSLDGLAAVLKDSAMVVYREVTEGEAVLFREWDTLSLRLVFLKSDRGWKLRHRVILPLADAPRGTETPTWHIAPREIRGLNYYPAEHPWALFGENFDPQTLEADFQKVVHLKMNTLRIFIPYQDFGKEYVAPRYTDQLRNLLDIAEKFDLQIILTLFDFYGDYSRADYRNTSAHLRSVVQAVKDHPALLAWDLKNEPDLDFDARGKEQVLQWLRFSLDHLHALDPATPVTIGWSVPDAALQLQEEVDLLSFHFYGDPAMLEEGLTRLQAGSKKPLLLGEFGKSSYAGAWNLWGSSEEGQALYVREVLALCKRLNIPYLGWTLYDFEQVPDRVVGKKPWRKAPQKHFGILDAEGNPKQAYFEF